MALTTSVPSHRKGPVGVSHSGLNGGDGEKRESHDAAQHPGRARGPLGLTARQSPRRFGKAKARAAERNRNGRLYLKAMADRNRRIVDDHIGSDRLTKSCRLADGAPVGVVNWSKSIVRTNGIQSHIE
ncbi:hypothetical protein PYH37_003854 [Sinorhizobium numidicum]|uniref:Transposase n=1 Tax=Sinorhizobium numidicum TaxID=680248 RepID=A0ABY8CZD5_9HYPH|nr:hypothetical protein [Sinorhizobium numidicum]WEX78905.1 hypothetical protein PYH37_003854 [Sinorhizobium numidicum]WEX82301.1 hypothetical protein PYH38_004566 [Sinorhizobium numidicum]